MADQMTKLETGRAIRAELLGPDATNPSDCGQAFDATFLEYVTETLWGSLWVRDGLDRRTRALLDVAILAAMGKSDGLGVHARIALRLGCSQRELQEVLMHVTVLAGSAQGYDAFRYVKAAIGETGR